MQITLATQEVYQALVMFCRLAGFAALAPGFGSRMIPGRVRLFFALAMSVAISPAMAQHLPSLPNSVAALAFMVATEVLVGIALGAVVQIITTSIHVAGTLIAYQVGMGVAQIANPSLNELSGIFASFLALVAMVIIFVSGAHHLLVRALLNTYVLFPPGEGFSSQGIADVTQISAMAVGRSFSLGVQLSIPFLVFGFAFYAGVGVLARLIPQIQVFFVSLPLSVFLGMMLLGFLMIPLMNTYLEEFTLSISPLLNGGI